MKDHYKELVEILKKDERLVSKENTLLKNEVINLSNHTDEKLLKLLLEEETVKNMFFKNVNGIEVFDKQKFNWVINSKEFLPDSYTKFSSKIGLTNQDGKFIKQIDDIVLAFPNKDCFLEFDSTTEEEKRKEIFYNDIIAKSEIDVLKDKKVFINAKQNSKSGEKNITEFDSKDNLIIKGNNLLAMYSLLPRYKEQVKLMYWDILYNTNNDIVPYNDSFKHSSWLVMMKNRLEVGKELLKKEGIIFIQCDGNEMHYLKVLCDEIFNRNNYIATITCKVKAPSGVASGSQMIFDCSEYILVYAKDKFNMKFNHINEDAEIVGENSKTADFYKYILKNVKLENKKLIKEIDGEKIYQITPNDYEIETMNSQTAKDYYDNYEKIFRTAALSGGREKIIKNYLDTLEDANENLYVYEHVPSKGKRAGQVCYDLIYKKGGVLMLKDFARKDKKNKQIIKEQHVTSIFNNDWWQGIASEGDTTLKNGKKPEILLKTIIDMATDEGDIVLDAFFGTGTTGAVAMKMNRKFIGIEQLDSHVEKAVKRIKKVIVGDSSGISKDVEWKGGSSFTYMEMAKNNMRYIDKIQNSSDDKLIEIYEELENSEFINYRIDKETLKNSTEDFKNLDITTQRKILLDMLDKNLLYINYADIDDEEYEISDEVKKFNRSYYEEQ